jgi:hypothetical protein
MDSTRARAAARSASSWVTAARSFTQLLVQWRQSLVEANLALFDQSVLGLLDLASDLRQALSRGPGEVRLEIGEYGTVSLALLVALRQKIINLIAQRLHGGSSRRDFDTQSAVTPRHG